MTNRRVGHALLFLAALAGFLLAVPPARADSDVRIVRLSYISGDVQMDRGTGPGFEAAVMNMPVTRGARLWAGDDGYAEVEFEDGSTARLTPGTELSVLELSLRSDGGRVSILEVQQGTAYFDIRPRGSDDFRVTVAGYDLQVTRHTRFRVSGDDKTVRVAVFSGALEVPTGDGRIDVGKDQTLTLDVTDPGRYEVVRSVSGEAYDQWDSDRASFRDNYQGSGSYAPGYASGYDSGISDLNYYGSYSYVSGWGWMWQPYFVYAGWNPWMDGAWVWYPGFGYVWVSAYPWGWMPYRYGGWYFISGHGWCWRPERHPQRWVAVAPVYNPPPNFNPPHPPSGGGGVHVLPVGRGPVTLFPDPDDRHWRGPRRGLEPGAPGAPVRVVTKVTPRPMPPIPVRSMGEDAPPPATGAPAQPAVPVTSGGAGSFKSGSGGPPVRGPERRGSDVHVALPPASVPQPPATPAPMPGAGAGVVSPKAQPMPPVTPLPVRGDEDRRPAPPVTVTPAPMPPPQSRWGSDDRGSSQGSGNQVHATPYSPPPSAPAPPPSSGPAQTGGGGYHPSPPPAPPAAPRSSGSSGGGGSHFSGGSSGGSSSGGASHSSGSSGGGSHSSGGASSGGSHSSGSSSSHSSSSTGGRSPK